MKERIKDTEKPQGMLRTVYYIISFIFEMRFGLNLGQMTAPAMGLT